MKIVSLMLLFGIVVLGLAACGGTAVNVNTAANAGRSAANGAANAVGSAVNTVANTIDNATAEDDFVAMAARSSMAEVGMGRLAQQKAADPEVKKFGQMMIDDHTAASAELKTIAENKNRRLPSDLGKHKGDFDNMRNLSGAEFDRAYVKAMIDAHKADVEAFEEQSKSAADADIKAFAAKQLPILKKHHEQAEALGKRILNQ
jgi:putative membrane protein